MITVAAATEDDIPRLLEIEQEAISPPWSHGTLLSEIYSKDSFFAVARSETGLAQSRILGFVILRQVSDESELFQIAVDREARRLGVADTLMNAAFMHAAENGLMSVYLEVRKSNEAAISLYGKHGFVTVRQRVNYYSDPVEDAIVMVKKPVINQGES